MSTFYKPRLSIGTVDFFLMAISVFLLRLSVPITFFSVTNTICFLVYEQPKLQMTLFAIDQRDFDSIMPWEGFVADPINALWVGVTNKLSIISSDRLGCEKLPGSPGAKWKHLTTTTLLFSPLRKSGTNNWPSNPPNTIAWVSNEGKCRING